MMKNQKIKRTLICGLLFFKWMGAGVFWSWLDCFSVEVGRSIENINFSSSVVFLY